MDQSISESEQAAIDAALVEVLRIFAARGRAIREERERLKRNQKLSENSREVSVIRECVSDEEIKPSEQCEGKYAEEHVTGEQPSINTLELLPKIDSANASR